MGGKGKNKTEPAPVIKYGKRTFSVGMKFEAKDSEGKWYGARVLKVNTSKKELLVHFDGWNARYDVWLHPNSSRIRFPVVTTKPKEKEWRIGDRVIAKWGPAGRIYPATISKVINESQVEITFYDGFKKIVSKSSLKPDLEKMYRQFDSTTVRKQIISPKSEQKEKKDSPTATSTSKEVVGKREKRQLNEPSSMTDYVTNLHSKRRRSKTDKEEESNAKQAKLTTPTSTKNKTKTKKENEADRPESPIPKVKVKVGAQTIAIRTSPKNTKSPNFVPEKLMDHCNLDLSQQQKNKNYVFFPVMDIDEEEDSSDADKTIKNDEKQHQENVNDSSDPDKEIKSDENADKRVKSDEKQQRENVKQVKDQTKQEESIPESSKTSESASTTEKEDTTPTESEKGQSVSKTETTADEVNLSPTKTNIERSVSSIKSKLERNETSAKVSEMKAETSESAEKTSQSGVTTTEISAKTSEIEDETSESTIRTNAPATKTSESKPKTSESEPKTSASVSKNNESVSKTTTSELISKRSEATGTENDTSESVKTSSPTTEIKPLSSKAAENTTETSISTTNTSESKSNLKSVPTKTDISTAGTTDTRRKTTRRSSANPKYKTEFITGSLSKTRDKDIKNNKSEISANVKGERLERKRVDGVVEEKKKSENDEASLKLTKRSRRISDRMETKLSDNKNEAKPVKTETKPKIDFPDPKTSSPRETRYLRKSVDAAQKDISTVSKVDTKQQRKSLDIEKKNEGTESKIEPKRLRKSLDALKKDEVPKEDSHVKPETKQQRKSFDNKQNLEGDTSSIKEKFETRQRKSTDSKQLIDEKIEIAKTDDVNPQRRSERRRTAKSFDDHEVPQSFVTRKKSDHEALHSSVMKKKSEVEVQPSHVVRKKSDHEVPQPVASRKKSEIEVQQSVIDEKKSEKLTPNTEKSSSKNFEQKYEEFKQKWKAEKEKRRLMKDKKDDSGQPTSVISHDDELKIGKPDSDTPCEKSGQITRKEIDDSFKSKDITKEEMKVTSPLKNVIIVSDKPKKGLPRGRPRKKKEEGIDISRTPNDRETISFASMVSDERPSLKKRNNDKIKSPPVKYKESKWKPKPESLAYDNLYKSYTASNASLTLTQIVASKIQRRAHQQQKQIISIPDTESNTQQTENKNELDLTGITLSTAKSPPGKQPDIKRPRKSLDFITGRLKYKKKMEELKAQSQMNKTDQSSLNAKTSGDAQTSLKVSPVHSIAQPTTLTTQVSQALAAFPLSSSQHTPTLPLNITPPSSRPLSITPPVKHLNIPHLPTCKCWNCFQNAKQMLKTSPSFVPAASTAFPPTSSYPPASMIIAAGGGMLTTTTLAPINVVPIIQQQQQRKTSLRVINTPPLPSPSYSPSQSTSSVKQEPSTLTSPTKTENQRKRKHTENEKQSNDNNKKIKTIELRRTRRDSEKHLKTTKSDSSIVDEYKCTLSGCGKSFRKQHLLDYHLKYFHTAKPSVRRNRSSISVSSTESNPFNALSSPIDTTKNISNVSIKQEESAGSSINISNEVDVVMETSEEEETESESETTTVDDCVKCVCEDECELGFMIQCEQCFTWQHGECVGYLTQKNVPLFYLCHVCSNPKGLRPSCKYNNDFTWQRFGRIPPVNDGLNESKIADVVVKETLTSIRHVDKEDEEILSNIMITSHAMLTDLYNIKDVLQNIRQKFVMIRNSPEEKVMKSESMIPNDDEQLEKLLLQIEKNSKKNNKSKDNKIDDSDTRKEVVAPVKMENDIKPISTENTKVETVEYENESIINKNETSERIQDNIQPQCESDKIHHSETISANRSDENVNLQETSETSNIIQSNEDTDMVDSNKTYGDMDQSASSLNLNDQSPSSINLNDQSETETETADEQVDDIKIENEMTEEKCDKERINNDPDVRPFSSLKDLPELPTEMTSRENVIARFQLLVEIERIEDEIEERLKDLNKQLDLLETEYDNIDRSKEILRKFKEKFQLPDMKSLAKFLHRIKWTSIRQKK